MKKICFLITLSVLAGCGAGKTAISAGKGFERFECMSRNMKGELPCPQPQQANPGVK